mgnify:CR=1 FL=1
MKEGLLEQLLVVAELVGYLAVTGALAGLGVLLEVRSYAVLHTGDTAIGVWMAGMGAVFLLFGVFLAKDRVVG